MPTPLQVHEAFRAVDEMRLDDFAALFTPDGSMTFGNGEPSVGPDAVRAALADFYQHLAGVRHELRGAWIVDDVSINEAIVHYTMKNGSDVPLPVVSILRWSGEKVHEWRIYMDAAPAFAAIAEAGATA